MQTAAIIKTMITLINYLFVKRKADLLSLINYEQYSKTEVKRGLN